MRQMIKTHEGMRESTGACSVCQTEAPLCISETGRLAYLCVAHRPWTCRVAGGTLTVTAATTDKLVDGDYIYTEELNGDEE